MTEPLRFLAHELADLEGRDLLRRPPSIEEAARHGLINLCSNDYLGFSSLPLPETTSGVRGGAGASPLVVGAWPAHLEAERALSGWLKYPGLLLFTSGYAANVGTLSALVGPEDLVLSDRLNHASIIDGCRLSGATVRVVPHLDTKAAAAILETEGHRYRRRLVATESYFSMDGDGPDLAELRRLTLQHDAVLYVDEAHAIGVFGPEGRGRCAASGIVPDVLIGTLGKALGLHGAFVAGSSDLRLWLWNRARSLVFSTGTSPAIAASVPDRVERVRAASGGRERLEAMARSVRGALGIATAEKALEAGPIIPWVVGTPAAALEKAARLRAEGILVSAIRPPTVPEGTARLRVTVSAGLSDEQIATAVSVLHRLH
ncbi:MAG: 8-amino-7-oxononanoate synthase [Polyangiaceae bacterium]|nr:8-amino-7-oxononanoate synthase [Polyangiaceae bacterium]